MLLIETGDFICSVTISYKISAITNSEHLIPEEIFRDKHINSTIVICNIRCFDYAFLYLRLQLMEYDISPDFDLIERCKALKNYLFYQKKKLIETCVDGKRSKIL